MANRFVITFAGLLVAASAYAAGSSGLPEAPVAQDTFALDRRISSLEQRLYSLESTINRLQMHASERPPASRTLRDPEVERLGSEVQSLRNRISELECGVVQLDERTLSAGAKQARERAGGLRNDPCRLNAQTPVQLSVRR